MSINFHKMHGAGNDFVLLDLREQDYPLDSRRAGLISDRRLGVGCDQILVVQTPVRPENAAAYEIWNSDGSRALQCGNGARCIGLYLELNGGLDADSFSIESPTGDIGMKRCTDGQFEATMGVPDFTPSNVPLMLAPQAGLYRLESPWGPLEFGAVSMGNPHALVLIDDLDDSRIPEFGAFISNHDAFPEGCNAGFAQLDGRDRIRLRVHERGAGETLACGSGACAAVAILRQWGRVDDVVDVLLPGGRLVIKWLGNNQPLKMKGPAVHVFTGKLSEGN
jgi:diaminopimelate epimerase